MYFTLIAISVDVLYIDVVLCIPYEVVIHDYISLDVNLFLCFLKARFADDVLSLG